MRADESGIDDPEALVWTTLGRLGMANLVGALGVFVYLVWLSPDAAGESQPDDHIVAYVATFAVFMALSMGDGFRRGHRRLRRSLAWLLEGRAPHPSERERVLQTPWRLVRPALAYWMLAPVPFAVLNLLVLDRPWLPTVRNWIGIQLGGLITGALAFLLVERTLRPAFALALAGEPPARERYLGIRPRLMLSWALGSGVPFLAICLSLVFAGRQDIRLPMAFLSVSGLVIGWLIMFIAARSVADPLEAMRGAVRRVGEGDLDVAVPVDDGGEVGLLEAGFNRMVAGLREERELRDLFGRHVGVQVARQALDRTGLGGEQRAASALFVDLIGSTALAQRLPVADVVATLNALFGAVVATVEAEGGWVNKFEGDGALCVFGAPIDEPDHAARALRAARALHQSLVRLRVEYPSLDAGIGVSCGSVVAGNVGAEQRYEYTVIGDPVNEAARLTEHAKQRDCRVLASEAAVTAGGEEARWWRRAGEFPIRGRALPTVAYEPEFD
ncbi:MAG TPA: adenylate/guanylate cyclase domain-containing protein [Acidimicrobiales bacterium]|nr:adenylate/guanylate cyclase domain-containing protein [Acidimicrobiales bacterium]